jgi:C-terminal processing protease CtpA/Prc
MREPDGDPEINTRLADIVVAWNVFRHFYPYWPEAGVEWDERLRPHLQGAYAATTREAQRDALRRLVADARDGHGNVMDVRSVGQTALLPLQLASIDGRIVIMASSAPGSASVGAVVRAIDGVPAARRLAETMALVSGTTQWKQVHALQEIAGCRKGAVVDLVVENGAGERRISLPCDATRPPTEKRPDPIFEASPGVWYVDLTRANMGQVKPVLDTLARAAAVVFDVRGYPTDAGAGILPHIVDVSESDRWMHVAKITGPFGQSAGWQSAGWNLTPAVPRLEGRIVFLTDARAISYAESVMGYVADRKLGTVVGSTTAGTNGNVAAFTVPGAFRITFTGMRVTRRDGHTPFHLAGVRPDVSVEPTMASVLEGTDPVLERALELAGNANQP